MMELKRMQERKKALDIADKRDHFDTACTLAMESKKQRHTDANKRKIFNRKHLAVSLICLVITSIIIIFAISAFFIKDSHKQTTQTTITLTETKVHTKTVAIPNTNKAKKIRQTNITKNKTKIKKRILYPIKHNQNSLPPDIRAEMRGGNQ